MRTSIFCILIMVVSILAGCHPAGPASVRAGRASYNMVIQQTNNEQLLPNLVRLRYRDTPYFLEESSVATTFDFTASAAGTVSLPESQSRTYDLGTGISFSEQPTISYTPLQGEDFVRQFLRTELQILAKAFYTHSQDDYLIANHQPVFDPPHAVKQGQHWYTLYWLNLVKNAPITSV